MSKLLSQLLSVDYPTTTEFGTPAVREGYYLTPDKMAHWGGMPYVRRFHGVTVAVQPGSTPEFRHNLYCRLFNKVDPDRYLPECWRPVGYRSPEMEAQSRSWVDDTTDIDVGRGMLTAMVTYFEPSPEMMEVQRRALVGSMVPTLTTKYPPMDSNAVSDFLKRLDRRIPKDKM